MADRQSDRFTSRWIEAVKVDIRTDFTDPKTPGLILRVTPNGVKSWAYLYRRQSDKRRRRVTLGKFPAMGLKEARVAAAGHLKGIAAGADPAHQTQEVKKIDTVDQLLDRYIKDQGGNSSWAREVERIFKKDVRPVIGGYKINKVSRPDIVNILNAVKDRGAGVGPIGPWRPYAGRSIGGSRTGFSLARTRPVAYLPGSRRRQEAEPCPKQRSGNSGSNSMVPGWRRERGSLSGSPW